MARPSNLKKPIIILVVVLAVVVIASVLVFMLLPGNQPNTPANQKIGQTNLPSATGSNGTNFKLNVLQRSAFTSLNNSLIDSGILPVRPPAGTGKANPFL